MARGRSEVVKATGEALLGHGAAHFGKLLDQRYIGITLQIDEGQEGLTWHAASTAVQKG